MIQFSRCIKYIYERLSPSHIKGCWRPPALPHRLQCSTIGRAGLNRRVRNGNGCDPCTHRHQQDLLPLGNSTAIRTRGSDFRGARHIEMQAFLPGSLLAKKHILFSTRSFLRKEVIQPHLPIRLPCYDFTPVTGSAFDGSLLAVKSPASGISDSHGVTGGVYKTRERIHRSMLICDY